MHQGGYPSNLPQVKAGEEGMVSGSSPGWAGGLSGYNRKGEPKAIRIENCLREAPRM